MTESNKDYSEDTISRLTTLFHEYSKADIISATKNTEAFASEVFDVTSSDDQRYYLKILRDQDPAAIQIEVVMQRQLVASGIGSPTYLEIKPGTHIGEHNKERFVLSKYIYGTTPTTVTPKLIRSFGSTLARFHDCLDGVVIPDNHMQWLKPQNVAKDITSFEGKQKDTILDLIKYGSQIFEQGLPTAVTHGDLWMSNTFVENDEITTVFDLETAERTVRLVDLGRTYTSMRFNSDYKPHEIINELIAGYNAKALGPLSNQEMDNVVRAIVYVCGACATWHAVHGTRYRDQYIELAKEIV